MSARVLAVWLDAAEVTLIEEMIAAGELPVLAALRARGLWARLRNNEYAAPETTYAQIVAGLPPARTGTWMIARFDPRTYGLSGDHRLTHAGAPPFYALGKGTRVAAFDLPQVALNDGVDGIQVMAWGGHSPGQKPCSKPPELYAELVARHGAHPATTGNDYANLDDPEQLADLFRRTRDGIALRETVTCDLIAREKWNLFFTCFGESHTGGHYFWPHPDCAAAQAAVGAAEALRTIYRRCDEALGRMIAAAGPDVRCVAFAPLGMEPNRSDLPGGALLPELLFRYSFPGAVGLDFDDATASPESLAGIKDWVMEAWHRRRRVTPAGDWLFRHVRFPWAARLASRLGSGVPLAHPGTPAIWGFQPVTWYQPLWPHMKAFALLTNSAGFARLNVRGRERDGIVPVRDFARVCDEITSLLMDLRVPETGGPGVARVIRVRAAPGERPPHEGHDADLVVLWSADVRQRLFSPRFGMLGPLPMLRAGGHTADGFLCAAGPGIAPAARREPGTALDIAPTVLDLLGMQATAALPGRSLLGDAPARQVA